VAPAQIDAGVADGLRAMGVSEADIEAAQAAHGDPPDEDYVLFVDCWEAWQFFEAVQTQWVYAGMNGRRVRLDYAGVESGARLAGVPRSRWPELQADLRVIELAVLRADKELAEQSK
jgi:hypothetical protein